MYAKGLCGPHYNRFNKHGSVNFPLLAKKSPGPRKKPGTVSHQKRSDEEKVKRKADRLVAKLARTHCAEGHPLQPDGYYLTALNKMICKRCARDKQAAKWGRPEVGDKPVGLRNKDKTHCPHGHEYTPDNTRIRSSDNSRRCIICERRQSRAVHIKNQYGLTLDEFDAMVLSQAAKCAICSVQMDGPHIDHDHGTGDIRGLLCSRCNRGLGHFQDNVKLLHSAIDYLEQAA